MKKILLQALLWLKCITISMQASQSIYTFVNEETASCAEITKLLYPISQLTAADIEKKIKKSHKRIRLISPKFLPNHPVVYILDPTLQKRKMGPATTPPLEWILNLSEHPSRANRLNLLVNTRNIASKNALQALGKHEWWHYCNMDIAHNKSPDNCSFTQPIAAGSTASLVPATYHYLSRKTSIARLPVKSMLLAGVMTAWAVSKRCERRKVLERRNSEKAADQFMIAEGHKDKNILTGALQQLTLDTITGELQLAAAQDVWHKRYPSIPRILTDAYVQYRAYWYGDHEAPEKRLRRVIRAMETASKHDPSELVKDIVNHIRKPNKVQELAQSYQLDPKKVKSIIADKEAECLKAVSNNNHK